LRVLFTIRFAGKAELSEPVLRRRDDFDCWHLGSVCAAQERSPSKSRSPQ
jgi:hypothetical protein